MNEIESTQKIRRAHQLRKQKINILLVRKFLRDLTEAGIKVPGSI